MFLTSEACRFEKEKSGGGGGGGWEGRFFGLGFRVSGLGASWGLGLRGFQGLGVLGLRGFWVEGFGV